MSGEAFTCKIGNNLDPNPLFCTERWGKEGEGMTIPGITNSSILQDYLQDYSLFHGSLNICNFTEPSLESFLIKNI